MAIFVGSTVLFASVASAQDPYCSAFDRVTKAASAQFQDVRGDEKARDLWEATTVFPDFDRCEVRRSEKTGIVYSCKKSGFATLDAAKDGMRGITKALLPCLGEDPNTSVQDLSQMGFMMLLMRRDDGRAVNLSAMESSRLDTDALKIVKEWTVTLNVYEERDP
jgi:hypothetical protein